MHRLWNLRHDLPASGDAVEQAEGRLTPVLILIAMLKSKGRHKMATFLVWGRNSAFLKPAQQTNDHHTGDQVKWDQHQKTTGGTAGQ